MFIFLFNFFRPSSFFLWMLDISLSWFLFFWPSPTSFWLKMILLALVASFNYLWFSIIIFIHMILFIFLSFFFTRWIKLFNEDIFLDKRWIEWAHELIDHFCWVNRAFIVIFRFIIWCIEHMFHLAELYPADYMTRFWFIIFFIH